MDHAHGRATVQTATLRKMLRTYFPALHDGRTLDRIIRTFDLDGEGKIDYEELVRSLNRMVGTFVQQLDFLFTMWDANNDDNLELWELSDALEDSKDDFDEMAEYLSRRFKAQLDENLLDDRLASAWESEPMLVNFLWACMLPVHPRVSSCLDQLFASKPAPVHGDTTKGSSAHMEDAAMGRPNWEALFKFATELQQKASPEVAPCKPPREFV